MTYLKMIVLKVNVNYLLMTLFCFLWLMISVLWRVILMRTFKLKMNFNPDPNKQAQEIIFSRKKTASLHPVVYFDNKPVKSTQIHKHLGMMLDSNLSYEHHIKSICNNVNKTIGLLRKFQFIVPRHTP